MAIIAIIIMIYSAAYIIMKLRKIIKVRKNSSQVSDAAKDIALASRLAASVATIFAFFLAPAGLFAFFVAPPLIVVIAPVIAAFAAVSCVLYFLANLYDQNKSKKK